MIDTGMAGERALNAVYVFGGAEPCLVEAAPEADGAAVVAGLDQLGIGPNDLAHIVVTHIHMDHAGGAGRPARAVPPGDGVGARARGAASGEPHPARRQHRANLRRSAHARSVRRHAGPASPRAIEAVTDGDLIELGDHRLRVLHTPGHASHHIALHDEAGGAVCTGEAIGSYLPWATAFRPALPPPEVDVELAIASIERIRTVGPSAVLTSHFGPVPSPGRRVRDRPPSGSAPGPRPCGRSWWHHPTPRARRSPRRCATWRAGSSSTTRAGRSATNSTATTRSARSR